MSYHIDSLAYGNKLRSLSPQFKIIFVLLLQILAYNSPNYISLIIIIWLSFWVVIYANIPLIIYIKLLAIPVSFWFISSPALILGIDLKPSDSPFNEDIIGGFFLDQYYLYLSQKGLEQAINALIRTLILTSGMYFIILTIPLGEIVRVLRKWGCPLLITELLLLMYRFIFVLTDTVSELLTAQKSRLGYINWRRSLSSLSLVISQLLTRTLENYREISLGLISRGFNGEFQLLNSQKYQLNKRYLIEAIGGYFFLLTLIIFNNKKFLFFSS